MLFHIFFPFFIRQTTTIYYIFTCTLCVSLFTHFVNPSDVVVLFYVLPVHRYIEIVEVSKKENFSPIAIWMRFFFFFSLVLFVEICCVFCNSFLQNFKMIQRPSVCICKVDFVYVDSVCWLFFYAALHSSVAFHQNPN